MITLGLLDGLLPGIFGFARSYLGALDDLTFRFGGLA